MRPENSQEKSPRTPAQRDSRCAERTPFMEYYPYELSESLWDDVIAIHNGDALSVNRSREGMLLLMDQCPPVKQVFEIQVPASARGKITRLVEVCWTRQLPIEETLSRRYLVGVKFLLGHDAPSRERAVPPII